MIGCGLAVTIGYQNGASLIITLSGEPKDEHVFATPKDIYNISYWCLRSILATLLFALLFKINHSTWKFNGSWGFRILTWTYACFALVGCSIYFSRYIKLQAFGQGAASDPVFYLRTARMYVVWQVCEYLSSVTIMVMVYILATQDDKQSKVKCLLNHLSKSWDYPAGDLNFIYEKLRKLSPELFNAEMNP